MHTGRSHGAKDQPRHKQHDQNEQQRRVATARVFLAVFAMVAFLMEPTQRGHSPSMYGLLGFYTVYSILVLILLRREKASIALFRLLVHATDVVWPAFISVFAVAPRSPFFLFFIFVLMAAAYRRGLWATLSTASAEVALLWAESFALLHVRAIRESSLSWPVMASLRFNVAEFEPKRLFVFSVYLLVAGLLLGYLAGPKKHLSIGRVAEPRTISLRRPARSLLSNLFTKMKRHQLRMIKTT